MAAFAIITRSVSEVWERASLTLRVTMDRVSDASEDQLRNSYPDCGFQILQSAIRHPPSAIRHPPSAIRHPPSAICHSERIEIGIPMDNEKPAAEPWNFCSAAGGSQLLLSYVTLRCVALRRIVVNQGFR